MNNNINDKKACIDLITKWHLVNKEKQVNVKLTLTSIKKNLGV